MYINQYIFSIITCIETDFITHLIQLVFVFWLALNLNIQVLFARHHLTQFLGNCRRLLEQIVVSKGA